MAIVIVPVSALAASGVAAPATSSAPPPVSATPAAVAWTLPGRSPSDSMKPAVPSRP